MKITIDGVLWTGNVCEVGIGKPFTSLYQAINYSNLKQQPSVYLLYDSQVLISDQEAKYDCYFVGMKQLGKIYITITGGSDKFRFHCNKVYVENLIIDGIYFKGDFDIKPIFKVNKSILGKYNYPVVFNRANFDLIEWSNVSIYYNGWKIIGINDSVIDTTKVYLDKVSFGGGGWSPDGVYGLDDKQPCDAEYSIIPNLPGITIIDDYNGIAWGESSANITYHEITKTLVDNTSGLTIDLSAGGEITYIIPPEAGGDGLNYITFSVELNNLSTTDFTENVTINKKQIDISNYGANYGTSGKYVSLDEISIPVPPPVLPTPTPWINTFTEQKVEIEGVEWNGPIKTVGTGKDFVNILEAIEHSNINNHCCVYLVYENSTFTSDMKKFVAFDSYFLGMGTAAYKNIVLEGACDPSNYCSKIYVENLCMNGFVPWYICFPLTIKTNKVRFKNNPYSTFACGLDLKEVNYINSCIENTASSFAYTDLKNISLNRVTYVPPWKTSQCVNSILYNDTQIISLIPEYSIKNGITGFSIVSDNNGMPVDQPIELPYSYIATTKVITFGSDLIVDLSVGGDITVNVGDGKSIIINSNVSQLPTTDIVGTIIITKHLVSDVSPVGYGPDYGTSGLLIDLKTKVPPTPSIIQKIVNIIKKIFSRFFKRR